MKVLLISGPLGVGRDEAARILTNSGIEFLHEKFSMPLRQAAKEFYGFSTDEELENAKRLDWRVRGFMIGLSELVVKELYGRSYFGELCAERVLEVMPTRVVITDSKFMQEVRAFCDILKTRLIEVPEVQLWSVRRPGYNYRNKLREPVTLLGYGTSMRTIDNNGTLEEYRNKILRMGSEFFK